MEQVIEAADPEAARCILSATYGFMRIDHQGQQGQMTLRQASLGPIRLDDVALAMTFDADADPLGMLVFGQLTCGFLGYSLHGSRREVKPGQVFLNYWPDEPYTVTIHNAYLQLAIIDPALPSQIVDAPSSRARSAVRFTGCQPISAQAAENWKATYAYVRDGLLTSFGSETTPLVTAAAARLLVATALATFPNNGLTEPTIEDRHDGSPTTLRHAVAFIDDHAHQELSLADIADSAQVTIRAVQLAFRRHLGTTPLGYLRRVRLDHAHRELQAASPDRETVAALASRWGFASPSRFAAYYRDAYGVSPSVTLRS